MSGNDGFQNSAYAIPSSFFVFRLESLPNSEVQTPTVLLRLAVDSKTVKPLELVSEVEPQKPERRINPEAGTGIVEEIAKIGEPRVLPDVARLDEHRASHDDERSGIALPQWRRTGSCRQPSSRSRRADSFHNVPNRAFPRTSEKKPFQQRDIGLARHRIDRSVPHASRENQPIVQAQIDIVGHRQSHCSN